MTTPKLEEDKIIACDDCGKEYLTSDLHKIGHQYVCDDCCREAAEDVECDMRGDYR